MRTIRGTVAVALFAGLLGSLHGPFPQALRAQTIVGPEAGEASLGAAGASAAQSPVVQADPDLFAAPSLSLTSGLSVGASPSRGKDAGISAQATLATVQGSLEKTKDAPPESATAVAGRTYEASAERTQGRQTPPVAVAEPGRAPGPSVSPTLSRPTTVARSFPPAAATRPLKTRLLDYADTSALSLAFLLATAILHAVLGPTPAFALALAVAWATTSTAMSSHLGGLRAVVVGGWQASHDQRYRVGPDGNLRDVRGHKYGADRYDRYAPGSVSRAEEASIRTVSATLGAAALYLSGAPVRQYVYYLTAVAVLSGARSLYRRLRPRPPPPAPDPEEEAHASRFH